MRTPTPPVWYWPSGRERPRHRNKPVLGPSTSTEGDQCACIQPEPGEQIREGARRDGWSCGLMGGDGEVGGGGLTPRWCRNRCRHRAQEREDGREHSGSTLLVEFLNESCGGNLRLN